MSDSYCWGIFRESAHSPGRETDDTEILRLTGKHLEARGFRVLIQSPEEIAGLPAESPRGVFMMCEQVAILAHLRELAARGVPHVNTPSAVLNTYRDQMIALLQEAAVSFVPSRIVPTRSWVRSAALDSAPGRASTRGAFSSSKLEKATRVTSRKSHRTMRMERFMARFYFATPRTATAGFSISKRPVACDSISLSMISCRRNGRT